GGNPNLLPETADTFTAGFVYQPGWLEGAAVTLDWWDVEVTDSITTIGVEVILSSCYSQGLANRSLCENVNRDATGFLVVIDDRKANIGGVESSGVDATFTFDQETAFGDFRYNFDVAYLEDYTRIQADGRRVNGKGVYDLGVFAEWKTNFNINFRRGNWGANYNLRWIDEFEECEDDDCSGTNTRRTVEDNWQHDVQVSYDFNYDRMGQGQVTFGVQNLLDEDPAKIFNGFLATSDSSTYDFLGRYFYLSYSHTL
ncbi:MAG: TonB-dependent receptor domain-containing protein, partial [Woeseia sp.]